MIAEFQFDVRYSDAQVKAAVRVFCWYILRRQFGWRAVLALGLTAVALSMEVGRPGVSWYEWMLLGVLAFGAGFLLLLYRAHLRQSLEKLHSMKEPVATFVARDGDLTVSSDRGSSTLPWETFSATLDAAGSLILVLGTNSMITVPTEGVDAAALDFIRERVRMSGGTVGRR